MSTRQLIMLPGPHEVAPDVLKVLGTHPVGHGHPSFITEYGECLNNFNKLLGGNSQSQPFIISGGGTIGWDAITSSLCQSELNHQVLILNNGIFADRIDQCCKTYNISTNIINAKYIGDVVTPQQLKSYFTNPLNSNSIKNIKLIWIVHVDTSSATCCDIKSLSAVCHKYAPNAFIAIDGICSFGAEEFKFIEWGIDAAITASQKAFGCPPGLSMILLSKRCVEYMVNDRIYPIRSHYANLLNWLPVMKAYQNGKKVYFSTPNVNLIRAMNVSCKSMINEGIDVIVKRHKKYNNIFRKSLRSIGLDFIPVRKEIYASTLTAIKFPKEVDGVKFLRIINNETGVVFGGGIHPKIKKTHFRVGHMGVSMKNGKCLLECVKAIEYGLDKCGYKFTKGLAVRTFNELMTKSKL